ncbi:exonuclease domain-containing protein [Ancylomarina sp. YFZ004]
MDFVAIDFEHAMPFKGSVCSVGIVSYKDGNIVDEYSTLIQPPNNEYNYFTTKVHGLTPEHTRNAPSFIDVYPEIKKRVNGNVLVAHNAFSTDKACLEQAMDYSGINEDLNLDWQCTYRITNAKLNLVAQICHIELNHHEALSDAKACAKIFDLYQNNKLPLNEIEEANPVKRKAKKKSTSSYGERLKGDVFKPDFENAKNKENPFYMKKVVVSGFASADKKTIAQELKYFGADVDTGIGKKTNFLIAGENVGPSKLTKMQANIAEGKEASIITHQEYKEMTKDLILNESC